MAVPSNRVPVRVARGLKAALTANLADFLEGELVYAKDEDQMYVIEGGALTSVAGVIDGLQDVDTTTSAPTDGEVLTWVNANGKWEPAPPAVDSNVTQGGTGSSAVNNLVTISQVDYDALGTPDANTVYFII